MSARLQALWMARTLRERWLLGIMFGLLGLVLVWFLVIRPLGDLLSAAKERHGHAVAELAKARSQAATIAALEPAQGGAPPEPIETAVAASAAAAGFKLSALQPQGAGRLSLAIGAARPQALFGWIAGLEAQGFIVERLNATGNPDRTLSTQIVLRTRGS